jgi:predicted  nucleic acid-binding Zn-ribbon protein
VSARRDSFMTVPETCPSVEPKYEFVLNRLKELEKCADDLSQLVTAAMSALNDFYDADVRAREDLREGLTRTCRELEEATDEVDQLTEEKEKLESDLDDLRREIRLLEKKLEEHESS